MSAKIWSAIHPTNLRKGQIKGVEKRAAKEQVLFKHQIFGVVA